MFHVHVRSLKTAECVVRRENDRVHSVRTCKLVKSVNTIEYARLYRTTACSTPVFVHEKRQSASSVASTIVLNP